jgi:hypothetical protein
MNATHRRSGRGPWTSKSIAAAAFFVLFLAFQIAMPLVKLSAPRPARFGWHMFTAIPKRTQFTLLMRDGTRRPVDLTLYVGLSRGEVNMRQELPPHLCRVVPDAIAVQITANESGQVRTHPCR